jgi:hypothetical protein
MIIASATGGNVFPPIADIFAFASGWKSARKMGSGRSDEKLKVVLSNSLSQVFSPVARTGRTLAARARRCFPFLPIA